MTDKDLIDYLSAEPGAEVDAADRFALDDLRATLTKTDVGWRVTLSAHGLPLRKRDGTYYQAWLENPAGMLVPIGTFNRPAGITMWSGVSPQPEPGGRFVTLLVTRRSIAGPRTAVGRIVLRGVAQPIR